MHDESTFLSLKCMNFFFPFYEFLGTIYINCVIFFIKKSRHISVTGFLKYAHILKNTLHR